MFLSSTVVVLVALCLIAAAPHSSSSPHSGAYQSIPLHCEFEKIYIWLKSIKSLICFKWLMIFKVWYIANSAAYKIKHWNFNFQLKFIEFFSICFVSCDSILKSFNIYQKSFYFFIKIVKLTAAAVEIFFFYFIYV